MAKYRKKPVEVAAEQLTEKLFEEFISQHNKKPWPKGLVRGCEPILGPADCEHCFYCWSAHGFIEEPVEGEPTVCIDDWIITHEDGNLSTCKPDIFEQTYERVE